MFLGPEPCRATRMHDGVRVIVASRPFLVSLMKALTLPGLLH